MPCAAVCVRAAVAADLSCIEGLVVCEAWPGGGAPPFRRRLGRPLWKGAPLPPLTHIFHLRVGGVGPWVRGGAGQVRGWGTRSI